MNALLRRRLEMAARVRDFLRAHKTDAVGEGLGLAKLEELIGRAEALDGQQRAGVVTTRLSTKHRKGIRRALQSKLLLYLRALGGLGDPENGEAAVQFQVPPSNASHLALLTAGRDMLEKATGQKDVLLSRGMPPTLLDDLAGALGGLEKTIESTRAGRRDHVGASADLKAVAVSGLGDEAAGITFTQPGGRTLRYYRIAWRYRNATASVLVEGFDGELSLNDAETVARKQQARMQGAA